VRRDRPFLFQRRAASPAQRPMADKVVRLKGGHQYSRTPARPYNLGRKFRHFQKHCSVQVPIARRPRDPLCGPLYEELTRQGWAFHSEAAEFRESDNSATVVSRAWLQAQISERRRVTSWPPSIRSLGIVVLQGEESVPTAPLGSRPSHGSHYLCAAPEITFMIPSRVLPTFFTPAR